MAQRLCCKRCRSAGTELDRERELLGIVFTGLRCAELREVHG